MDNESYLKELRDQAESFIDQCLPAISPFANKLVDAMRYSVLGGGKRLRAILALGSCQAVGGERTNALPVAAALEMIHAYSLVHDDLPAMDNDDYRRGKLTTHKKFGESMGILAGDGLLTHAFYVIASKTKDKLAAARITEELAWLSGVGGMVSGQVADVFNQEFPASHELLEFIHHHKTGALIIAACKCGAIAGGASEADIQKLAIYGAKIGLAFQIVDDILDVTSTKETMGKAVGKDVDKGKLTYPRFWGIEKSTVDAETLIKEAKQVVNQIAHSEYLVQLADYVVMRKN